MTSVRIVLKSRFMNAGALVSIDYCWCKPSGDQTHIHSVDTPALIVYFASSITTCNTQLVSERSLSAQRCSTSLQLFTSFQQ